MITADEVNKAYVAWRVANDQAVVMSHMGLPQDQLNAFWKAEEEALEHYTTVYEQYDKETNL